MHLELKNIDKSYKSTVVFNKMNFDFSRSGLYLIQGKSGSGKTTLLNILAGYEGFEKGQRVVDQEVNIVCIFQSYELIEELTVYENIAITRKMFDEEFDDTIIKRLELESLLEHYPSELSGGQRQKVGIARALYNHPDVIICDEPTESLDIENKEIVLTILKELARDKVVIIASHEIELMKPFCDYYYEIEAHDLVRKTGEQVKPLIEINRDERHLNIKVMKKYLKEIISKRTLIRTSLLWLLVMLQIVLFCLDIYLFSPETGMDASNARVVYVNTYDHKIDEYRYFGNERLILNFEPVMVNKKLYKVNVFPEINNRIKDNEVIINQNTLKILGLSKDEAIGQPLKLSYRFNEDTFDLEMKIAGVVDEKDVGETTQIYYNYDYLVATLQSREYEIYNQYDYLLEHGNYYEIYTSEESVEHLLNEFSNQSGVRAYHSILSNRLQIQNEKSLYHLLFIAVEVVALVITWLYLFYYVKSDTKKNSVAMAIIGAFHVPMRLIKKVFLELKLLYLIIIAIGPIILLLLLPQVLSLTDSMLKLIMSGYVLIIVVLYLVILSIQLLKFTKDDIAIILKDGKDF